jgi:hypothetical protein
MQYRFTMNLFFGCLPFSRGIILKHTYVDPSSLRTKLYFIFLIFCFTLPIQFGTQE